MTYWIEFRPAAMRELAKETSTRRGIGATLELAKTPVPGGGETSHDHRYQACGDYRIIYEFEDRVLIILVLRIGHRRQV